MPRLVPAFAALVAILAAASLAPAAPAEAGTPRASAQARAAAQQRQAAQRRASRPAPLAVTGYYGPATTAAVRRYQALHGLPATGVADRRTTWSLGLVVGQALWPGQAGAGVRALQRALRHHERFAPRAGVAPRPHRPTPRPRPFWSPPADPFPILAPEPEPAPATPATPVAPPPPPLSTTPVGPAWLELFGGAWTAPVPAGGPPALWQGGGALWLGDWGLAAEYALAPDLGALAPGDLLDAQLRYRGLGPLWLGLGYRGLAGEHLGALGLGLDVPLGLEWLRLRAAATGGSTFGAGWAADGRAGLGLAFGPVWLEGGYRALAADAVGGLPAMGLAHGTYGLAGLRF